MRRQSPARRAIIIGLDDASMKYILPMPRAVEGGVAYEALEDADWHLASLAAKR